MIPSMRPKPILLIVSLLLAVGITGCVYAPPREGPPPHAPAYGYRYPYYYDYYYYPSVPLYFHIYTGYYYYLDHGRWVRTKTLPRQVYLHHNDRVKLRIEDDKPYRWYNQHQKQYRSNSNLRYDKYDDRREREYNQSQYETYHKQPEYYRDGGHHR